MKIKRPKTKRPFWKVSTCQKDWKNDCVLNTRIIHQALKKFRGLTSKWQMKKIVLIEWPSTVQYANTEVDHNVIFVLRNTWPIMFQVMTRRYGGMIWNKMTSELECILNNNAPEKKEVEVQGQGNTCVNFCNTSLFV